MTDKDRKKILVIDDERDLVTYLTTFFEDNGLDTVSAFDGEEGLEKVKSEKPDLITLDITMPNKSGVKFYREIKEDRHLSKIPVIIITGISGDFRRFISTRKQVPPPDAYISKPIDKEGLLKTVRQLIS